MTAGAAGRSVLLLDDEPTIRESLGEYLEDCGIATLQAESGEEALAMDGLEAVAVAVVDIRLGGMDGIEFIKALHALRPDVRFLIHTGSTDFQLDPELRAIGLTECEVIFKPVLDMSVFERAIRQKLAEAGS
ncbi:response regulator [Desulfomicrobium escambiense]|uniref:response regulator n=1 Tax=Desulfomicrobium escambiense TaxID=29503 RepID=UPI00048C74A2|nr:response regulator [Desulfomicrobium escambiense]